MLNNQKPQSRCLTSSPLSCAPFSRSCHGVPGARRPPHIITPTFAVKSPLKPRLVFAYKISNSKPHDIILEQLPRRSSPFARISGRLPRLGSTVTVIRHAITLLALSFDFMIPVTVDPCSSTKVDSDSDPIRYYVAGFRIVLMITVTVDQNLIIGDFTPNMGSVPQDSTSIKSGLSSPTVASSSTCRTARRRRLTTSKATP